MTSWAGRYVSTTRRGSSASPTCLRDWSTSSCTRCETCGPLGGALWRATGRASYPDAVHCEHPGLTRQLVTQHVLTNPIGTHFGSQGRKRCVDPYLCMCTREGDKTVLLLGGGEDILCHVCFVFLLQNETRETLKKIPNKDKCTVFTFAWSASTFPFSFHHRDVQISICILFPRRRFFCPRSFQLLLIRLAPVFFAAVTCVVNTVFLLLWVWPWLL